MSYGQKIHSPLKFIRNGTLISIKFISIKEPRFYWALFILGAIPIQCAYADSDVKNNIDFAQRSRFASIDDNSSKAASILLRLNLNTQWNDEFRSTIEMDSVISFFKDDHSDGVIFNGKPVIPDASGTEINQAFVSFNRDAFSIKLGRQRINFDDQRFIGGNGFWQNEQTFDALLSRLNWSTNSSITYAYAANVNRIFGERAGKYLDPADINYTPTNNKRPANFLGDHKLDSHLTRIEWNEWDYSQWVSYLYIIDNKDLPGSSNNTLGSSYDFNYKFDALKYRLKIEAALQKHTNISDSPTLPYYLIDMGANIDAYEISARYEMLSAKDNVNFITPLGSLHDFQGWANVFSPIPKQGIKDASLGFLWRAAPFKIDVRYHTFFGYMDNNKLGNEIDVDFIYKPAPKHTISLRFADFTSASNLTTSAQDNKEIFLNYSYNM
ncbi:MAG: alginate export family protein [Pseudomonadota bacterium]